MTLISPPAMTHSVNQTFFIEALGGSQNPVSYLDRFPETVYTKALDSLLVKFLYALVGPVGVGLLRQEYLEARLQVEQAGLSTADIDSLYTNAFGFARLAEETYQLDAAATLLPSDQRAAIEVQDASFRNRAIDFLKGARAGGTLLGAELVARSGLNRPVEAIENYRALYDRYTDLPLDLPYFGQTSSAAEVIIIPRQVNPQSAVQTLTLSGQPRHGWFTLTFPRGQSWQAVPVTSTAGSNIVTVPAANLFPPGVFVTLTSAAPPNTVTPLAPSYQGAVLADNPTAYWRLNESSGAVAADASGNGYTGTYAGGFTLGQPGPYSGGKAVQLDGATGYVYIHDAPALRLAVPFSLEAWIRPTSLANSPTIVAKGWSVFDFFFNVVPGGSLEGWAAGGGGPTGGHINTGVWSHVVATFDGVNVRFYVNGTLVATVAYTGTGGDTTATFVEIGTGSDSTTAPPGGVGEWFQGAISDVALYNYRLTDAQVGNHYATKSGSLYAVVGANLPNTTGGLPQVSLLYPPSAGVLAGQAAPAPASGNFVALVGNAQTIPIAYNATAAQVQDALVALPVIGAGNVVVTGGPLPDRPVGVQFAKGLSDQTVPQLQPNLGPDAAVGITAATTGGTEQLSDVNTSPLTIGALVETTTAGISADGQVTTIAPADEYAMQLALDQTLPLTTLVTTRDGNGPSVRQPQRAFVAAPQTEVLEYVTGQASVHWPPPDSTHWIEASIEHEAPRGRRHRKQHHHGFHRAKRVLAYIEAALLDPDYDTSTDNLIKPYWNSLIGHFSPAQRALMPGLQAFSDAGAQYLPTYALATAPQPLVISADIGTSVINDSYPIDYYSLPGVKPPTRATFWSSMERPSGTDYLEIDLGTPQAVNYLYFEASRKPFLIDVAYDTLDQDPSRAFQGVTVAPVTLHPSLLSLTYDHAVTNMWQTGEIFFANALGGMIYTRFLRIGFTRAPMGTPFAPTAQTIIPYSIEIRNLRIGRNVSGPHS